MEYKEELEEISNQISRLNETIENLIMILSEIMGKVMGII